MLDRLVHDGGANQLAGSNSLNALEPSFSNIESAAAHVPQLDIEQHWVNSGPAEVCRRTKGKHISP